MEAKNNSENIFEICELLERENKCWERLPLDVMNEWIKDLDKDKGFDMMMNKLISYTKYISEKLKEANEKNKYYANGRKDLEEELKQNYRDLKEIQKNLELFHSNFQLIKQIKEHMDDLKYMKQFLKDYEFKENSSNTEYRRVCNFIKKMKEMKNYLFDELYETVINKDL